MSNTKNIDAKEARDFRARLLAWYDVHRRSLPWRALPDQTPNPYHVWLSEIMLQQTTVQAVIPYFLKFVKAWPDVYALANASNEDVMQAWAGLGYYARARNLHKCAKVVSEELNGQFPTDVEGLKALPGIGEYTSAAIASIAFGLPANVVDGNVERVMARYHKCETPLPRGKKDLKVYAAAYADGFTERTGDYAQSLMDLGATVCTPKSPVCALCPVHEVCRGYNEAVPSDYPKREPKKPKPRRQGYVYLIQNSKGQVLLHKRPEKGLLGGMQALPTSEWLEDSKPVDHLDLYRAANDQRDNKLFIEHVFTHFALRLNLHSGQIVDDVEVPQGYKWYDRTEFDTMKFPTVFKKAVNLFRS